LRVDWVILCRYAEVNDGLATIVGAGIDALFAPELPCELGFPIVIRIVGLADGREHTVEVEVLDPEMQRVAEPLSMAFTPEPGPQATPGWEGHAIFPAGVVFEARQYGAYLLNVKIDDNSRSVAFEIREPPS
jgi:hypothetical protein